MSSSTGATLAHRAISNIRTAGSHSPSSGPAAAPGSPHTPLRSAPSTFGSPSSLRAEEEVLVVELGARKIRVGFAGDSVPKGQVCFGPEQQRRVGDFRLWEVNHQDEWRRRSSGNDWANSHELYRFDVRELDMGLVGDKVERALREAFTKYLLIDSRPRRILLVLPSGMPIPLLSTILDTLFNRFQAPSISLFSAPVMSAVAAGVRSALIVDLGWQETVVTSVYEYREVQSDRSIRGGKVLLEHTERLLKGAISEAHGNTTEKASEDKAISFEECEDIVNRLLWCKTPRTAAANRPSEGLATVTEQDESDNHGQPALDGPTSVSIPLHSTALPMNLEIPYDRLAEPCETAFFESQFSPASFDDEETPLHLLVYQSLLKLPMDVRALCMARIIFTGGCSKVLGLRSRIFNEVARLVEERGWDAVRGKGVDQLKTNPKLQGRGSRQAVDGPTGVRQQLSTGSEQDGVWHDAANAGQVADPIEDQLKRGADTRPTVQGHVRAIESLGAWSGASMLSQIKVSAVATVDRELWQQQGVGGASKPGEVDFKAQQRQSMGAGGLMRGAVAGTNWTLGVWGAL